MSAESQSPDGRLAERVTELEMLFTHLQRTVQELDRVVIQQGKQIDTLALQMKQLQAAWPQVEELLHRAADRGEDEFEPPPHY